MCLYLSAAPLYCLYSESVLTLLGILGFESCIFPVKLDETRNPLG